MAHKRPSSWPYIDCRGSSLANLMSILLVLIKNQLDKKAGSPECEPLTEVATFV